MTPSSPDRTPAALVGQVAASPRPWLAHPARFVRVQPLGAAALLTLALIALAAAGAPWLSPYPYDEPDFAARLQAPSRAHPFGTDNLGRDLLSRVLFATRVSLALAAGAVLLAESLATAIALLCGYYGGWLDKLVGRVVDLWLAVPVLIFLVSLLGLIGPGFWPALLAIGLLRAPGPSRLLRSVVIGVRAEPYVEAARALGAGDARILLRHILPNVAHVIIYSSTVALGGAMILVASLGFLGYGVPPPHPDLGGMLSGAGLQFMRRSPWLALWPGLTLMLIVLAVNLAGDALRDLLDPRLRGSR